MLIGISKVICSKTHQDLRKNVQNHLASSLGFEHAAILFYDPKERNLYGLNEEDPVDRKKNILVEENVTRVPTTMGMTGLALMER